MNEIIDVMTQKTLQDREIYTYTDDFVTLTKKTLTEDVTIPRSLQS